MKGNNLGIKRLHKEHKDLSDSPNPNFVAEPDPDNLFDWHFCLYNLKGCPYEGGYYHGMLKFPKEYPMKPPSVIMLTPSGRFQCGQRICLTISDWHPESWNPIWKVESIVMGLLSFMLGEEHAVAAIHDSEAARKTFAKASLDWNLKKNPSGRFSQIFDSHFVRLGLREGVIEPPPKKPEAAKEEEKKEAPKLEKKPSKKEQMAAAKEEKIIEAPKLEKKLSKKEQMAAAAKAEVKIVEAPKVEKKLTKKEQLAAAAKAEEIVGEAPKLGKRPSKKEQEVAAAALAAAAVPAPVQNKRGVKEEEKKQQKEVKVQAAAGIPAAPKKLDDNFIYVQCVKVGSKIRLRIVNSTCFNNNWNCQGPRNIRIEGVVYKIDNPKVKVMYGGALKASFYKLSNDSTLYKAVVQGATKMMTKEDLAKRGLKIFEETDCVICLDSKPNMVFDICGHMCICKPCYGINKSSNKCIVCNTNNYNAFVAVDGPEGDDDE